MSEIVKLTRKQAGYIPAPLKKNYASPGTGVRCGECKYFSNEKGKCAIVYGKISPQGCCNVFTRKSSNSKVNLEFLSGSDIEDLLAKNPYFK